MLWVHLRPEVPMPEYDYTCQDCLHAFTVDLQITDHAEKDKKHEIRCPKCGSSNVKHVIGPVFVTTSKKS
jgi:putative FmdB family regulatory protein